jgi:hypothetical protein
LCCNSDAVNEPGFKIGGDDTVTLVDASGTMISTTGGLADAGTMDKSYAVNDAGEWAYTTTTTPNAVNIFTEHDEDPMDALIAQNDLGEAFFGMDREGMPVTGFDAVVDIR